MVPFVFSRRDEAIDVSLAQIRAQREKLPFYVTHVTHGGTRETEVRERDARKRLILAFSIRGCAVLTGFQQPAVSSFLSPFLIPNFHCSLCFDGRRLVFCSDQSPLLSAAQIIPFSDQLQMPFVLLAACAPEGEPLGPFQPAPVGSGRNRNHGFCGPASFPNHAMTM
ncbi:hypothetical protein DdX_05447 [Ditylenchus destructor]|uniref:Uncharacterized protein n=1 Tax=Ditylenchus destructor TaxID=166010 RepID=A0AAD4NCP7_9BILA|nr:hypothetical protein DdX_05447 [Ditylenchus destructor]